MTVIEAEAYPFDLDPARANLVIIDMQRDFPGSGGFGAALGNNLSLLRRTIGSRRHLLEKARAAGLCIVHTREGTPDHDMIPELYPLPGEPVVDEPGKGAFHATDLDAMLKNRGISQLIVRGVTAEVCVNTTVQPI